MKLPIKNSNLFLCAALVAFFCAVTGSAVAQIDSGGSGVSCSGDLPESLTVSPSISTLNFTLTPFTTTIPGTSIIITTSWVLASTRSNVELDAYFASASQALANGSYYIPTSKIYGNVTTLESGGPSANAPFTQTAAYGPAGAGLVLFSEPITAGTNSENVDSTTLALKVDLSNSTLYKTLPAGTYTGTLTIEAKAI
jgi:hypothetical protein